MSNILAFIITILLTLNCNAGSRFSSRYPCSDAVRQCVSGGGTRTVDGVSVYKDCWEWSYVKKCEYPSKDDCAKHAKCYSLGQKDCVLRDSLGNCVNILKEFSCKRWTPVFIESETVRYGTEDKDGREGLVCKGIPCIDGNCIDKSYDMDADMVSSLSQLSALSMGKNTDAGFKIFEGAGRNCSKIAVNYLNCCQVSPKGWGRSLGSKCSSDEQLLSDQRQNNLCIAVGVEPIKQAGVKVGKKRHYCCWGNLLEKTIQVQARKQLKIGFGSGGKPDCRGLTFEELSLIDFSKIDFSEVAAEMHKKMVLPNVADVELRIKDSFDNSNKFDHQDPDNYRNKAAGVNKNINEE